MIVVRGALSAPCAGDGDATPYLVGIMTGPRLATNDHVARSEIVSGTINSRDFQITRSPPDCAVDQWLGPLCHCTHPLHRWGQATCV